MQSRKNVFCPRTKKKCKFLHNIYTKKFKETLNIHACFKVETSAVHVWLHSYHYEDFRKTMNAESAKFVKSDHEKQEW